MSVVEEAAVQGSEVYHTDISFYVEFVKSGSCKRTRNIKIHLFQSQYVNEYGKSSSFSAPLLAGSHK